MPEKVLDSSLLFSFGWEPSIPFEMAAEKTYKWFKMQCNNLLQVKN
jgi:nucleoside-diphosphate-sugar epimerase